MNLKQRTQIEKLNILPRVIHATDIGSPPVFLMLDLSASAVFSVKAVEMLDQINCLILIFSDMLLIKTFVTNIFKIYSSISLCG